ncbi:hypothetical protein LUZ61_014029 [Rhynchospora tenuis]|uniref:Neprosin PEP catalytic domain-containing protein n=1 Tax=Rhynchospora tenuis TaxID=198213 RepID=A0AAD5W9W1_9POAL|nr:hypothetical protein LUZ61_014029 [Rhynchospora tenuis]
MGEKSSVMKVCVILSIFLVLGTNATNGIGVGGEVGKKNLGIEKQVRMLNKPYVTSFKTEGRDRFDCVEIRKQPAFDHPLLKHHVLQLKPSPALRESWNTSETPEVKSMKGCPEGTVPIRRTSKEDLLRARNIAPVYVPQSTAPYDGNLDPARLDWWIAITMNGINDELMGYFPHEIFNNLADSDKIEFGGIVYSPSNEKIAPPMGSGVRPNDFGGACEFKQVAYMSGNGIFHPPAASSVETFNSNPNLYGIGQPGNQKGNNGYVFSFGGPGGLNV